MDPADETIDKLIDPPPDVYPEDSVDLVIPAPLEALGMPPETDNPGLDMVNDPSVKWYGGYSDMLTRVVVVAANKAAWEARPKPPRLRSVADVARLLQHLSTYDQEHAVSLSLDADQRLLAIHQHGIGSVSKVLASPRDVLKVPLMMNAAGCVSAHSHPTGNCQWSPADIRVSAALATLARSLEIKNRAVLVIANRCWANIDARTKSMWTGDPSLAEPYGGYESYLVQTALLREKKTRGRNNPMMVAARDIAATLSHLGRLRTRRTAVLALNHYGQMTAVTEFDEVTERNYHQTTHAIVAFAFVSGASRVIVAHGHPGRSHSPTEVEAKLGKTLKTHWLRAVRVALAHHAVVTREGLWLVERSGPWLAHRY